MKPDKNTKVANGMNSEIIWICDCSGSMQGNKIQSLNYAIRSASDELRRLNDNIYTRMIQYSDHASWLIESPVDLETFLSKWEYEYILIPDTNVIPTELIFLMDTSSSMEDELISLKNECHNFVQRLSERGLIIQAAIVGVGIGESDVDPGPFNKITLGRNQNRAYTLGITELSSEEMFLKNLNDLQIGMFGNRGCYFGQQSSVNVFNKVSNLFTGYENQKLLIVITDEVGGCDGKAEIISILRKKNINCSIIGKQDINNVHSYIAENTGGFFYDIRDRKWGTKFSDKLSHLSAQIAQEKSNGSDLASAIDLLVHSLKTQRSDKTKRVHLTVILTSDGKPSRDITDSMERFQTIHEQLSISKFAIGIGQDFDKDILNLFVNKESESVFSAVPPKPEVITKFVYDAYLNACGRV